MFYSEEIIKKYSKDEKFLKILDEVLKKADEGLDAPEVSNEDASGSSTQHGSQHGNYYSASLPFVKFMPYLCFAYRYTGDEKYAKKAKKLMLLYASFDKWHGNCYGNSELNNAHFCKGMSIGYTTISDFLTNDEKQIIAKATFEKGISPIADDWVMPNTRLNALDTMGHNWWCVCVSNALLAAVSMQEKIGLDDYYIERLRDALEKWFNYQGNPMNAKPKNYCEGGFYESLNYLNFSLDEYAICNFIYKKIKGKSVFDDTEYMENYLKFFANTVIPSSKNTSCVKFGDGAGFASSILWVLGNGIESPEALWYISQWKERDISYPDILFYDKIHCGGEKEPEETSVCYEEMGWAVIRKSFDVDSPVLAVKCGDSWNHAHLDAGHFTFSNHGDDIIYDSGSCPYVRSEYVDYYCASEAHNVVLFNGQGQDDRDRMAHARMTGKLYNLTDTENFKYIAADATGPMGRYFRRHLRHFLWLDDFILIYDDIEAHESGEVNFLMHIEDEFSDEFLMLTESDCVKCDGKKNQKPDEVVSYDSYNIKTDDESRAKIVSAVILNQNVSLKLESKGDFLIVISDNAKIYINTLSDTRIMHQNCIAEIDGFTTDAVMFAECEESFFVVNGSMLRYNGESLYDNIYRENIEIIKGGADIV